jgi:AraC family transcriptional regulator of adaptative response/methylated-DNA-[protein]-cysteine methyltransferase
MSQDSQIKSLIIDTPLGSMMAIADDEGIHILEFVDQKNLEASIQNLRGKTKSLIFPGENDPLLSIKKELCEYFDGSLQKFKTPLHLEGSEFQKNVWSALQKIPYGQTRSYAEIATTLNKPSAFRAVANANGANKIAIVIPCHRVINSDGKLGGYAGGISRKQWLLNHEKEA